MKKNTFKTVLIIIIIISLLLNVLLLLDKLDNKNPDTKNDNTIENSNPTIEYDKETLSKLFKDYQVTAALANSDKIVIFDVTKITYVGSFKSDKNKKLYYIDEKFSCMEGNDCVSVVGKVTTDKESNNNTTFVVAVTPLDKDNAIFEILDYSIENNYDFQKDRHVILK